MLILFCKTLVKFRKKREKNKAKAPRLRSTALVGFIKSHSTALVVGDTPVGDLHSAGFK